MASTEISPTLDFLTDAAHLMRATAPETSSHLMSQRSNLMFSHDMAVSEVQRQHVCGGCGHIMIPGNESTLKMESRRPRRGTTQHQTQAMRPKTQAATSMTKSIRCSRCDRVTKTPIAPPAPISRSKIGKGKGKAGAAEAKPQRDGDSATTKPSANSTSKKRAKNRKAGLQALLAGQQQQKPGSLSLSDFMRK